MAIMGYAEMLMDDAAQAGRAQRTDDLQRILDASRTLHRLILSLLDPASIHRTDGNANPAEFRRTLRHDLRTPINAIKGYGEMLREDAADEGADTFVADLDKLLKEATLLLDSDRWSGDIFWWRCSAIGRSCSRRYRDCRIGEHGREPAQSGPPDSGE